VCRDSADSQQLPNALLLITEVLGVHTLLDVVGVPVGRLASHMRTDSISAAFSN